MEGRVIDVLTLRPLMRALVPIRTIGYVWVTVTRITWGPGGTWCARGVDGNGRRHVSAWSNSQTVEVW